MTKSQNGHDDTDAEEGSTDLTASENTPRVDASQIQAGDRPPEEGRRRQESASRGSTSGTEQATGDNPGDRAPQGERPRPMTASDC